MGEDTKVSTDIAPAPSQDAKKITSTAEQHKPITLSRFTNAVIENLHLVKPRRRPDELSKLTVSQTVSLLAFVYEKVRNAIEYLEEHLVRRAAIERILKRRLALNPAGNGEAENVLREIMWARYFPIGSLGEDDIAVIQSILNKYLSVKKTMIVGRDASTQRYLYQFLIDLLTCEIEETLSPDTAAREASFTYFLYQTLRNKVQIEGLSESQKDAFFLSAIEKSFRKSDEPYLRYHIFVTFYKPFNQYTIEEIRELTTKLPYIFKKIDDIVHNPYADNLSRFIRKQLPPYLILFDILRKKGDKVKELFSDRQKLWQEVDMTCRDKYQQSKSKLQILAFKSLIYIFVTKMLFAIILEYPVSLWLYNHVNMVSIVINSVFPPILMLIIVLFFKLPGEENTARIYYRIIDIIDADRTFETTKTFNLSKKKKEKRPVLVFGFTIFYTMTFIVTFFLINRFLVLIHFNAISQIIFIFFVTVITFFSYRIKQVVREYRLVDREGVFAPFGDFFFMPVVSLGKFFSMQLGRLNFFIVLFDFFLEAPFKLIIEIVEEWITFVRARKEEIV